MNWQIAFQKGSQKHQYYWEAFQELEKIIAKEASMPLPRDRMAEDNFVETRNKYVDEIVKLFNLRGTREYQAKINTIVRIVEDLLNN